MDQRTQAGLVWEELQAPPPGMEQSCDQSDKEMRKRRVRMKAEVH